MNEDLFMLAGKVPAIPRRHRFETASLVEGWSLGFVNIKTPFCS